MYTAMKSDLRTLSSQNVIIKYADDVNLLVLEFSDVDAADEFNHIKDWASRNKMILNSVKTKELVFHRPNPSNIVFLLLSILSSRFELLSYWAYICSVIFAVMSMLG